MSKAQVNIRIPKDLISEVENLVKRGIFSSKTEAFSEAVRLLIRTHKGRVLAERMDRVREGTEGRPNLTEVVISSHEEEDVRLG